ncbi:nuclease-related domain-containing protein [Bacillus haimaensis]|uniref:nuclease-related domain-containing protein n=1 Tax=Bacillus haimaensis TaxID=3160967 RepID=UPI003AA80C4D
MIKKPREKSVRLLTVEAGSRRVRSDHPKYPLIEAELGRLQAGYRGEQAMDYYLTFLPAENYQILHGLRLEDHKSRYFQMDTVLLSPSHCLLLDSKNVTGELEFDEKCHQLKRKTLNGYEALGDPISQVERQKHQLEKWMENHIGKSIPIISQVVLTNKNATLLGSTTSLMKKVTFLTNLPNRMNTIHGNFPNSILDGKELRKLVRTLIKKHIPDTFALFDYYDIPVSEFINGVICPDCMHSPMKRRKGFWLCIECGCKSRTAHVETLKDYYLLIGNTITNKKARELLLISSKSSVLRILQALDLPCKGQGKNSVYTLDGLMKS